MQMLTFSLVRDNKICNISYFGEGVTYQSVYDKETETQSSIPIYRDDKKSADRFIIREVNRMLNEGWELAGED